jgi:hypothetical protein
VATNYPYVSAPGALIKAFEQFRKQVPSTIDADLLRKFGIAPGNESYVINTLRFLAIIDEGGKRVESATDFFYGDDSKFKSGLEHQIKQAYSPLFDDHGEEVWDSSKETLTTWFRVSDKTSDVVGGRQAKTFQVLSTIAGHGDPSRVASSAPAQPKRAKASPKAKASPAKAERGKESAARVQVRDGGKAQGAGGSHGVDVGLTVRIEVNLPADGTPEVYDSIFASVRKHLIDRD